MSTPSARPPSPNEKFAQWLLAGSLEPEGLLERIGQALHCPWPGADVFVRRMLKEFPEGSRPALAAVTRFSRRNRAVRKLLRKGMSPPPPPVMCPAAGGPQHWGLPAITSPDHLARFLGTEEDKVEWLTARGPGHYRYRWIPKRNSGMRLLENPKPLLKSIQRQLHRRVLAEVPPHDAVHSFRRGRSIKTFAEPHPGHEVVLRLDLLDFFPSVGRARVTAFFRTAGYPEDVAAALGKMTTSIVPTEIATEDPNWHARTRLEEAHLPQGAPSSPALSNLVAYRLDCRLASLAETLGASYTRYADDLAFSGDRRFRGSLDRFFIPLVGSIVLEEGFTVNMRKNRVMGQSRRQKLAGVVVNRHPNSARATRDQLRAILHNCRTGDPASQNRHGHRDFAAHLRGRIAAVAMLDASQGQRLLTIYEEIDWSSH